MVDILIIIMGLVFMVQAILGLHFFVSSIWEREKRASLISGLQFFGMLALLLFYYALYSSSWWRTGVT